MIVIKKSGKKQKFDKKKIVAGLIRSGAGKYAGEIAGKVAKKLKGKKKIKSSRLREEVINELHLYDEKKVPDFVNFKKAIRHLSSHEAFLENRLRDLAGNCGKVEGVYGGFKITVMRPNDFDYCGVLKEILIKSGLHIIVELRRGKLVIIAR